MIEYLFLIIYSVILLCVITAMSITGMTIYDAVIYTNFKDSNLLINNEIEEHIKDQTSNNIIIKNGDGYHFKTATIIYDNRTNVLNIDEYTIPLSSDSKLAFFFLSSLKKNIT